MKENTPETIWHARQQFAHRFGLEPNELWVTESLTAQTVFGVIGKPTRIMGMSVYMHDGPITLIARQGSRAYRWRMGVGFDQCVVVEGRVAVWK